MGGAPGGSPPSTSILGKIAVAWLKPSLKGPTNRQMAGEAILDVRTTSIRGCFRPVRVCFGGLIDFLPVTAQGRKTVGGAA